MSKMEKTAPDPDDVDEVETTAVESPAAKIAKKASEPPEAPGAPAPPAKVDDSKQEAPTFGFLRELLRLPQAIGWRDQVIGGGLATTYVIWLLSTARSLGFARDEGFYFRAATDYGRWFKVLFERPQSALDRGAIDSAWATNHEHPALMKSLFSLSWMFLHEKWKVFEDASTSFRFPGMVMAALGLWLVYIWARAPTRAARASSPRSASR